VIAFYIIAQFWLTHRRVFRHVVGHRDSLAWWNFAFLATITIMPFTSNLLGEYGSNPLAVDIFAANLLLAVLATRAMIVLGRRWGLMAGETDALEVRALRARTAAIVTVVALSVGLAWVNITAAKYCWLLIPVVQWTAEHRSARPASPSGPPGTPGQ
jgi:TMEM175 potassium channel family protein